MTEPNETEYVIGDEEYEVLVRCVMNQDKVEDVNPYVTAIRVGYGPRAAGTVFKKWMERNAKSNERSV